MEKKGSPKIFVFIVIFLMALCIGIMLYIKFKPNNKNKKIAENLETNLEVKNNEKDNDEGINNTVKNNIIESNTNNQIDKIKISEYYFEAPNNFEISKVGDYVYLRDKINGISFNFYKTDTESSFEKIIESLKDKPIPTEPNVTSSKIDNDIYNGKPYIVVDLDYHGARPEISSGYYMDVDSDTRIIGVSYCSNVSDAEKMKKVFLQVMSTIEIDKKDIPEDVIDYDNVTTKEIGQEIKIDNTLYMTLEEFKVVNLVDIPEEYYRLNKNREDYNLGIAKIKLENKSNTSNAEFHYNSLKVVTNNTPTDYYGSLIKVASNLDKKLYDYLNISEYLLTDINTVELKPGEKLEGYTLITYYSKGDEVYMQYSYIGQQLYKYKIK